MNNIEPLRRSLREQELDALVIFSPRNVFYACGFPAEDSAAVVTRERAWFFTDSRYIEAARAAVTDAQVVLCTRENPLWPAVKSALEGCRRVGAEENAVSHARWLEAERRLGLELVPAQKIFSALRSVKQTYEIACITAAQRIAEQALDEVLGLIRPGITEREIAAELTYRMMRLGGEGNSFDPISITGPNTSKPHGVPGERAVQSGDFVTMDFGCIKGGYCSDMTRTVAVGSATEEMRRVYATVLDAQRAGIEKMRAGATGREVHEAAAGVIAAAGYGEYFGHGFGHSVGLDIHESPSASPANTSPPPAGAVVTAEPGIYLPQRFGVRIEDMIVIGENAPDDITKAPKELIIL